MTSGLACTWGKSIDNGSSDRNPGGIPPDATNIRAERALSDFDRTHVFTGHFLWTLPGLRRQASLRGWQLSGLARMWTGRPSDAVMSTGVAGIGATQNRQPDVIGDARGPRRAEEWFNRAAFARPATGTSGNIRRNRLRGPGVNKWDLTLQKSFTLAGRLRLNFRTGLFNAFNHPSFTTVGTSLTTTAGVNHALNGFGVVTATRDARVVQLALCLSF